MVLIFFFKEKTAYEMRISDWSSDVCSSDLVRWRDRAGAVRDSAAATAIPLFRHLAAECRTWSRSGVGLRHLQLPAGPARHRQPASIADAALRDQRAAAAAGGVCAALSRRAVVPHRADRKSGGQGTDGSG